jgi:hypothetical protein
MLGCSLASLLDRTDTDSALTLFDLVPTANTTLLSRVLQLPRQSTLDIEVRMQGPIQALGTAPIACTWECLVVSDAELLIRIQRPMMAPPVTAAPSVARSGSNPSKSQVLLFLLLFFFFLEGTFLFCCESCNCRYRLR